MLYMSLFLRNMKRSMKEYLVFMITMILCTMFMFAFNAMILSKEVTMLLTHAESMMSMFTLMTIFLVFVLAWLISYIAKFMQKTRAKEFGLYSLMGMKRKTIANMFSMELCGIGFLAFLIGCIAGVLFYQVLLLVITKVFSQAFQFSFAIAPNCFLLTFVYFIFMWIITLFKVRRNILKVEIRTLLYQNEQNEKVKHKRFLPMIIGLLCILSFIVGLYLGYDGIMAMVKGSDSAVSHALLYAVICLLFSVYSFYYCLSSLLDVVLLKHHSILYQQQTLLLVSHIRRRLKSNRFILATLSVLTIIVLLLTCFTMKFKDATDEQIKGSAPYDIQVYTADPKALQIEELQNVLRQEGYDFQDKTYSIYQVEEAKTNMCKAFQGTSSEKYCQTLFMKESDYRDLLKLLKKELPKPLQDHEYYLLTDHYEMNKTRNTSSDTKLSIHGKDLQLVAIDETTLGHLYDASYFIVKDEYVTTGKPVNIQYVANTKQETKVGLKDRLENVALRDGGMLFVETRADYERSSLSSYITLTFALLYVAFVFVCVQATIMATQQMMDVTSNAYHYGILKKLGMRTSKIQQLLWKQIGMYFIIPLLLPLLYMIPLLYILNQMFTNTFSTLNIYVIFLVALGVYLCIYSSYFLMAYIGCKKKVIHTPELKIGNE